MLEKKNRILITTVVKEQFGSWLRAGVRRTKWVRNKGGDEKKGEEARMGIDTASRNSSIGREGRIGEGKEMACSSHIELGKGLDRVEGVDGPRLGRESEGGLLH